jgi:hypothetical protein
VTAVTAIPKRKLRSRAYPVLPLGEALRLLDLQTKLLGWGRRDRDAIAKAFGYISGNSGIAARKIAALTHFGLLELRNGLYSPTHLAERVLEEMKGDGSKAARQEACLSPVLFREIIHRYEPVGRVPRRLSLTLSLDHGIQEQVADEVAQVFMESAVYAGILESDGVFREEYFVEAKRPRPLAHFVPAEPVQHALPAQGNEDSPEAPSSVQVLKFFVTDQKAVEIRLPARLNEQDILLLRTQIDFLELQVKVNRPDQPVRLDVFRGERKR